MSPTVVAEPKVHNGLLGFGFVSETSNQQRNCGLPKSNNMSCLGSSCSLQATLRLGMPRVGKTLPRANPQRYWPAGRNSVYRAKELLLSLHRDVFLPGFEQPKLSLDEYGVWTACWMRSS